MQRLSFFTGLVLLLITGIASVLVTPMAADAQTPDPAVAWVKIYTIPTAGATTKQYDWNGGAATTGYVFPMDSDGELSDPRVTEVKSDDVVIGGTQIGIAIRLTNVTYANGALVIGIGNSKTVVWDLTPANPLHDEFIYEAETDDQTGGSNDEDDTREAVSNRDWTLVYLYTLPTTRSGEIKPRFYADEQHRYPENRFVYIWGSQGSAGGNKFSSVASSAGTFKDASGARLTGSYPQARHVQPVSTVRLVDAAGTRLTLAPRSGKSRMIQNVAAATTHGYSTPRLADIAADNCAYYGVGDDVNFRVEFRIAMTASGTDKSLRLKSHWGNTRGIDSPKARLVDGDGTRALTFRYTVAQGDNSIGVPLYVSDRFHQDDNKTDNPALKIRSLTAGQRSINPFISWSRLNRVLNDTYGLPPGASPIHPNRRKFLVDGIRPSVMLLGLVTQQTHTIETGFLKEPIGRNPQFAADPAAGLELVRDNPDRESPHLQRGEFHVDLRVYNYRTEGGREVIVADEVEFEASDITLEPSSGAAADWDVQVGYIGLDHRLLDGSESNWARYLCYRVVITPALGFKGNVAISLPAGATQDIAGNENLASNVLTVPVDTRLEFTKPPEIVAPAAGAYAAGQKIEVEMTFNRENLRYDGENPPYLTLYLGEEVPANARHATWERAEDANSTSTKVTFTYTVAATDVAASVSVAPIGMTVPKGTTLLDDSGQQLQGHSEPANPSGEGLGTVPPQGQGQLQLGESDPGLVPRTDVPINLYPFFFEEAEPKAAATDVPRSPIVFNELGNGSGDTNDWLELRNVTGSAVSLTDWELSIVQDGKQEDTSLVIFPDVSVPADGLLLITHSDPTAEGNLLAGGDDIATADVENKGSSHLYLVQSGLSLPDDGQFLLILRKAKEKLGLDEAFVDVAGGGGSDTDAFIREQTGLYDTHVWPLQVLQAPGGDTEEALGAGKVWQRADAGSVGYHQDAWAEAAFTGLGYDRQVTQSAVTAGTPGYPNGALKPTASTPQGSITFSEIMFDSAGGTLPQWIEVYNRSKTEAINLNRWKLEIQNVDSEDLVGRPIVTLTLQEKVIQPNQTLLIVAGPARASSGTSLPADRVYDLLALHEKNLRIKRAQDTFLSAEGLYLKLWDSTGTLVDEVGNTDGNRRTKDAPAWALAMSPEEGVRSSLIRRYTDGTSAAQDGTEKAGWVLAANVKKVVDGALHWGSAEDIGTPGYRRGGALPVELSSFSLTRTEAGAVVLSWTTESEVDNAGFNLRRSEKRQRGFTLINPALIAGAGTTGERQTYTFTDSSAKPGVEYYYQIEEVAFDGKRETLAMRMLRGPVSAANRALTTFGEVKRQREE